MRFEVLTQVDYHHVVVDVYNIDIYPQIHTAPKPKTSAIT
jgi:hypothetical protein